MLSSICQEITQQRKYLNHQPLQSIYLGGGTPSLLSKKQLNTLFQTVRSNFELSANCEISLEANPDDLTTESLEYMIEVGINRLSIGIQSFHEPHLKFMNRSHSAAQAAKCVDVAKKSGIKNISVDVIYGIPFQNHSVLVSDLEKFLALDVDHISAYCLTIEPKTVFGKWTASGKLPEANEDFENEQFDIVMSVLKTGGYEQYEISNFAKNKKYSQHNTAYWQNKPYLGIGPSAHSYNGQERRINISNNNSYLKAIEQNTPYQKTEKLSETDICNEYLLTNLRTSWGVSLEKLEALSGGRFEKENLKTIYKFLKNNWVLVKDNTLYLTDSGKHFADSISADLFI